MLAIGMLGSWVMNVLAMRGDFYVVWLPGPLALLVLGTLASSIMCCWLLFRILVWKPSDMLLRPLCSIVVALCSWAMDFCECTMCWLHLTFLWRKLNTVTPPRTSSAGNQTCTSPVQHSLLVLMYFLVFKCIIDHHIRSRMSARSVFEEGWSRRGLGAGHGTV